MILKPSLINHRGMQFLITHAPDDDSLPIYVKVGRLPPSARTRSLAQELQEYNVTTLVREARKNAMNNAQVEFLMKYKRKKEPSCCSIF